MKSFSRMMTNLVLPVVLILSLTSCGGGGSTEKTAPIATINATPQLSVNENESYSFNVSTQNFKSSAISFSASNLPSWASINESTGTVSGTPSFDDAGVYSNISITATAAGQTASLKPFQIEVINVNRAPVLTTIPSELIAETVEYSSTIEVTDADGDAVELILSGLPSWLSFDATSNVLSGTPSLDDAGVYSDIIIKGNDGYGEVEIAKFSITVENSILISGKVIDGYIAGAEVFLDENLNFQKDELELSTVSDANGYYSFIITPQYFQALLTSPIRAYIGAGATDASRLEIDFNQTPIVFSTTPLTTATAAMESFAKADISPFTNKVAAALESDFVKLASGELTITELSALIVNQKNIIFDEVFAAIDVNANELNISRDALLLDLFSDFSADEIAIPKIFQAEIIVLAEQYTDTVISEQDERDTDNDGIANNVDDDDDGDGVADTEDAFPLDSSESQDSDADGVGDNADSYPQDRLCYAESDGNGEQCYLTWMASQDINFVKKSQEGLLFFLGENWSSILILNTETNHFLSSIAVVDASSIEYSNSHQRLYVGFIDGRIQYVNSNNELQNFANVTNSVQKLISISNYLVVADSQSYDTMLSIFNETGDLTDSRGYYTYVSRDYSWDPINSKLYHFRDGISPNDIFSEIINQTNGTFGDSMESPYHGDYSIQPPITISNDGSKVLLGSGDIYESNSLTWQRSIGRTHAAAYWTQNDELVTVNIENDNSLLMRRDVDYRIIEQKEFEGRVLNVFAEQTGAILVLKTDNSIVIKNYLPSDDSDNDGVNNREDAFPLDVAASRDSDNDGYPDEWNTGYTQYDSTTGLTLDNFPLDSACWLVEHGGSNGCDYGATVPNFTPEQVIFDDDGNIYLLNQTSQKIYRWSSATNYYSNPIAIGTLIETSGVTATKITYSLTHNRIYIGYENGAITFIDLAQGKSEQYFTSIAMSVGGLAAVGNYVLAQDSSGAWKTHYIFDQQGTLTDNKDWNYYSRTYTWNERNSRVYFLRDDTSPNDLHYETIDQNLGVISDAGETPYHSSLGILHPIRLSFDATKVMLGSGNIYDADNLTLVGELSDSDNEFSFKDHHWFEHGIVTIEALDEQGKLKIWSDDDYQLLAEFTVDGEPLALIPNNGDLVVVSKTSQGLLFTPQLIADRDQDGLPAWWEVLYQLDDTNASDAALDSDTDGLTNLQEFTLRTNPTLSDSDNDGLSDGAEVNEYGTEPLSADSDNDGLSDGAEVNEYGTDPLNRDSDADGLTDYDEVNIYQTDPLAVDTDNDGLGDLYEITYNLNPTENDAQSDFDNDGLVNIDELNEGTNPTVADSDYDGLDDGAEVHTHLTNPLVKDSDNDRMRDDYEITYGFDPLDDQDAVLDADTDGFTNMEEYFLKTNPLDNNSTVTVDSWTTYQGNAGHTGFVPVTIDSNDISLRWSISAFSQNRQVVAANGRVFIANNSNGEHWISAHNATNGQEIWRNHYDNSNVITPALANGRVFVQTRQGNNYLRALDVSNGSLFYRENFDYSYYDIFSPTPYDNNIYVYDGANSIYSLNESGERQWTYYQQVSSANSAATVNENYVFIFDDGLQILNRTTGESEAKIKFPENISPNRYKYNAPVVGSDNNVLLVESSKLFNFDINKKSIVWQIALENNYNNQKQVASGYGLVFAIQNGLLSVFDESNGELLWGWEPANNETINSNILLTRNLVFVGTQNNTYAIDLSSHQTVWQTEYTGQLSLSNEGALFIAGEQNLVAFTVSGDSDNDGIPDWWEIAFGLDVNNSNDASLDSDNDGLSNLEEFQSSTEPNNSDTDNDGLTDGEEVNTYNTEPLTSDSDNDGLSDGDEVNNYSTDPLTIDSDNDGLTDYQEIITYASNPLSADSDSDGMSDAWEVVNELNVNSDDAQLDADADGLVNIDEFTENTDPNKADTDSDGLTDGEEVHTYLTNPLNRDSDQDRMTDSWEIANGFAPLLDTDALSDIDNDGFANFEEFYLSTDPNDVADYALAQPWVTFQGNAEHNGFVVTQIDNTQITEMWRVDLNMNPHQVVAAAGKVFVTNNSYFGEHSAKAFNSSNGTLLWQNNYSGIHSLNAPAYANGQVYYQTGGHEDSFLRGVDANTGEVNFASAYGNQWSRYLAPTPYDGNIYMAGGYYGGTYAFDNRGNELFYTSLPQIDRWTPLVDENKVYACTSSTLNILNRTSGEIENTITSNDTANWFGCSSDTTVTKGAVNNLIASSNQSLHSLDLSTNLVSWQLTANFSGQPSVAYGRVFIIRNGSLAVFNEVDGTLLWSFEAPEGGSLNSNIVVTRNLVFVANGSKTYAIDLDSHLAVWNANVTGHLSLSEGVLYVAGNQQLVAFNIDGDDDNDGLPNWWENNYGLDPDLATDAALDNDSDGLTNLEEYTIGTNPINADSDEDTLSDGDEVNTYGSNPLNTDSDDDGLTDGDEVNIYNSDPIVVDTDGDGFSDGDEVNLYQTDPADANSAPVALTSLIESFEDDTIPVGWSQSGNNDADWFVTDTTSTDGSKSLRAGNIADAQKSTIEYRNLFAAGTFSFKVKVDSESCCDRLRVYVDGNQIYSITGNNWQSKVIELSAGEHRIKFSYVKDNSVSNGADTAWIDEIIFAQ